MGSILESTLWGKTALRLLLQCNELDSQHPAIMHMRHTERIASFKGSDGNYASTSLGKEAAAEFGSTLPKHREYIDYSTPTLTEHVRPLRRYAMVLWDPVEELSSVERSVPILHWIGKPF